MSDSEFLCRLLDQRMADQALLVRLQQEWRYASGEDVIPMYWCGQMTVMGGRRRSDVVALPDLMKRIEEAEKVASNLSASTVKPTK